MNKTEVIQALRQAIADSISNVISRGIDAGLFTGYGITYQSTGVNEIYVIVTSTDDIDEHKARLNHIISKLAEHHSRGPISKEDLLINLELIPKDELVRYGDGYAV